MGKKISCYILIFALLFSSLNMTLGVRAEETVPSSTETVSTENTTEEKVLEEPEETKEKATEVQEPEKDTEEEKVQNVTSSTEEQKVEKEEVVDSNPVEESGKELADGIKDQEEEPEATEEKKEEKPTLKGTPQDTDVTPKSQDVISGEPEKPADPVKPADSSKQASEITFTLNQNAFTYTGAGIRPVPQNVKAKIDNSWQAVPADQYDVSYANNLNVGTATATVKGKTGTAYAGCTFSVNFSIHRAQQHFTLSPTKRSLKYKKTGRIVVKNSVGKLTFTSSDPSKLVINQQGLYKAKTTGKVKVTVTATGDNNYAMGKKDVVITVTGKSLKKAKIKLSKKKYTYNGKKRYPKVTVKYKGKKLKKNRDFKVKYVNNLIPGKATVTVYGIGKYDGRKSKTYIIKKAKNPAKIKFPDNALEEGKTAKIRVKHPIGKVTFKSDAPSIASVSDRGVIKGLKRGVCTITVNVAGSKTHKSVTKTFKVYVGLYDMRDCKVKLNGSSFEYTGQEIKPSLTVKYHGRKLKEGTDYTVTYKNNVNAGKASVVISGTGKGINTKEVKFTIRKAPQKDFTVTTNTFMTVTNGSTFEILTAGAFGNVTYKSNSPTYVLTLGNGKFQAAKTTRDYVTVTVTASGDANHKSKSLTVKISIKPQ